MKIPLFIFFNLLLVNLCLSQTKQIKQSFTVGDEASISAYANTYDETCFFGGGDGQIDLNVNATGLLTFEWQDSFGTIISNNEDLTNLVAGDYSVSITNLTGCTLIQNYTVNYYCPYSCPDGVSITNINDTNCTSNNGALDIDVSVTGNFDYQVYLIDGYNSNSILIESGSGIGPTSFTVNSLDPGRYEVSVTDPAGPCFYYANANISSIDFYFYDVFFNSATTCASADGSITFNIIDPSLPNTFNIKYKNIYTGIETTISSSSTSQNLIGLVSGYYYVLVEDLDGGCILQTEGSIGNTASLTVNLNVLTHQTSCTTPNGAIDISVTNGSGSYQYAWTKSGGGFNSITQDIAGLVSGTYYLEVLDLISRCSNYDSYAVSNNGRPIIAIDGKVENTNCSSPFNGSIAATISGTPGPFNFSWQNSQNIVVSTGEDPIGLAPDTYGVSVTSASNGCVAIIPSTGGSATEILDNSLPTVSITENQNNNNTNCNAPYNALLEIDITAGGSSYTTSWVGPNGFTASNIELLSNIDPGVYTVTTEVSCPANQPPVITPNILTATTNLVTLNVLTIISDPDANFIPTAGAVSIVQQPTSGAVASIVFVSVSAINLEINYTGINFTGLDELQIEACDDLGACTQNIISIQVDVSSEIIVYNAFSPNSDDNINPFFKIENIQTISPENKVSIYNRWGDIVYEVSGYNNDTKRFEGTSDQGKELPSGTYFYKIEIAGHTLTGYLSLKR